MLLFHSFVVGNYICALLQMVKGGLSATSLLDRGVQLMGDINR